MARGNRKTSLRPHLLEKKKIIGTSREAAVSTFAHYSVYVSSKSSYSELGTFRTLYDYAYRKREGEKKNH